MSLTSLFKIDDIYQRMFDKRQTQYNNQGYSGAFPLFDVWGDIETDLDFNKADYEGMVNLRVWCSFGEIEVEQPSRGMISRTELPRDRTAYRCDENSRSVYIEFPKYVRHFELKDDYDYMMLIIALNKCLKLESPRDRIEKEYENINAALTKTGAVTNLTIGCLLTVESFTKQGRFVDNSVWTKTQLSLRGQSISITATYQDGFAISSIESDTVIKIDKEGRSRVFVDKGISGFEIWEFTVRDEFIAFLSFVSQL